MPDIAISLDRVGKTFKLYGNTISGPILDFLCFWSRKKKRYREFTAVENVSFEVHRGEIVGIVGPNGGGKTTLLKMIAGLLAVDEGTITVNGSITALLALGVGIHPEFTGRENIIHGGMLLGMSKREVNRKLENIIEFSELGDFINRPLRTYSSGMRARLLFSISMSIDPDVLIVDEALATGDSYFVRKCTKRIREMCRAGATVLFVSHNLTQVEQLCNRALFMAEGSILDEGDPLTISRSYQRWAYEKAGNEMIVTGGDLVLHSGTGDMLLTELCLRNRDGEETNRFLSGEKITIEMSYQARQGGSREVSLFVGIIEAQSNTWVGEINSRRLLTPAATHETDYTITITDRGMISVTLEPLLLLNNHYSLWIILNDVQNRDKSRYLCEYKGVGMFFVAKPQEALCRDAVFYHPASICHTSGPTRCPTMNSIARVC